MDSRIFHCASNFVTRAIAFTFALVIALVGATQSVSPAYANGGGSQ